MEEGAVGPIIATFIVFAAPVIIIVVAIQAQLKRRKKMYESIVKAMELGKDPAEIKQLFIEEKPKPRSHVIGFLRGGIVVAGVGIGLAGMARVLGVREVYSPAVFVLVVGLSLMGVYWLTKPKDEENKS